MLLGGNGMRTIKEIIQSQVDYTILETILNILYQQQELTETEYKQAINELKEKLNPPIKILENYNE